MKRINKGEGVVGWLGNYVYKQTEQSERRPTQIIFDVKSVIFHQKNI